MSIIRNITKYVITEQALKRRELEALLLSELAFEGLAIHTNAIAEEVNASLCAMTGYTRDELLGRNLFVLIHPDDHPLVREKLRQQHALPYEVRGVRKDGSIFDVELEARNFSHNHTTHRVVAVRDLTYRKAVEQRLEEQLNTSRTLLREVNHRIMNNFTSIENLITLKSRSTRQPETADALNDIVSAVAANRLLYEKLLMTEDQKQVSARLYLPDLADSVLNAFSAADRIHLELDIGDLMLESRVAFPLASICTELLTNAVKYAYRDGACGIVRIVLKLSSGQAGLSVSDEGAGFSVETEELRQSFGLVLVRMLAEQIDGKFTIESAPGSGTHAMVTFPLPE